MSPKLVQEAGYQWLVKPTPSLYIPLESTENDEPSNIDWREKLVIGHSVGYDRSYVKEQYYIKVCYPIHIHFCISLTVPRHPGSGSIWEDVGETGKTREDLGGSGKMWEDLGVSGI